MLYSPLVGKVLAQVAELKLDIDMIAPDHGLIWRNNRNLLTPHINPATIIDLYDRWSKRTTVNQALVIYDSMWQSTAKMAKVIGGEIAKNGVTVKMMNLAVNHRSDVMTEVLESRALVFGSPTLNNGVLPRMADFLTYLKGLKPKGKIGAAFGSYGWSGEAVKQITADLEAMEINVVDPGLKVLYVPRAEDFMRCKELGKKVVDAMRIED
jgi:flavorubredoxin